MPKGRGAPSPRRECVRPAHWGRQKGRATESAPGDDQVGQLCASWQALRFEHANRGMSDDSCCLSLSPTSDDPDCQGCFTALSSSSSLASVANTLDTQAPGSASPEGHSMQATSGVREGSPRLSQHLRGMGCYSVEGHSSIDSGSGVDPSAHRQLVSADLSRARTMLWACPLHTPLGRHARGARAVISVRVCAEVSACVHCTHPEGGTKRER